MCFEELQFFFNQGVSALTEISQKGLGLDYDGVALSHGDVALDKLCEPHQPVFRQGKKGHHLKNVDHMLKDLQRCLHSSLSHLLPRHGSAPQRIKTTIQGRPFRLGRFPHLEGPQHPRPELTLVVVP